MAKAVYGGNTESALHQYAHGGTSIPGARDHTPINAARRRDFKTDPPPRFGKLTEAIARSALS